MKKIKINNLVVLFIALSLFGCQNADTKKPSNPEEFAKLLINYKYRLDSVGLKSLLSEKCIENPFDQLSFFKNNLTEDYKKKNVNFSDEQAHDFSSISCEIISETSSKIDLECSGVYKVNDLSGKAVQSTNLIEQVELVRENGNLALLPNSCK